MLCLKELCCANTEITRVSVALDLPEFQWNQPGPRVYTDFLRSFFDKQSSFICYNGKKNIFLLHTEMYRHAHSYANF